ncbi:MAG: hypothetical protein JKY56_16355 [Kofleriaceae bacterium]|nr:hypothetical protein [Kofleriaceae bacterium]
MNKMVSQYLSGIGRTGGKKSRRTLSPQTARNMVKVREARRAFRSFYASCFWSFDPQYKITIRDLPWVATQLKTYGGRRGWEIGHSLCP